MTTPKDIGQTIRANYLQPAFLICAGVLAITASAMSVTIKLIGYIPEERAATAKKAPFSDG